MFLVKKGQCETGPLFNTDASRIHIFRSGLKAAVFSKKLKMLYSICKTAFYNLSRQHFNDLRCWTVYLGILVYWINCVVIFFGVWKHYLVSEFDWVVDEQSKSSDFLTEELSKFFTFVCRKVPGWCVLEDLLTTLNIVCVCVNNVSLYDDRCCSLGLHNWVKTKKNHSGFEV